MANIGAYGLLRFGAGLFPAQLRLAATALVVLGAMSLVYGAVLAVARGDVGESLAYSAIGQVGYVLVAIGVGGPVGLTAAVLYSVVNALNKTLLFLTVEIGERWWPARSPSGRSASRACRRRRGSSGSWRCSAPASPPRASRGGPALRRQRALAGLHVPGLPAALLAGGPVGAGAGQLMPLRVLTAAVALVVLATGLWPEPLLAVSGRAAEALLAGAPG